MNNELAAFGPYLIKVVAITFIQLFTLFGPGLLLVSLLSQLSGYVQGQAARTFGVGPYLLLFGGIGTFVHEISHLLVALVFGNRITGFKGFPTNPRDQNLGYVEHTLDANSLWKMIGAFFIGIAPVVFGTLFLFAALLILFERELLDFMNELQGLPLFAGVSPSASGFVRQILTDCAALLAFIFQPAHWLDWRLYVFLYLAFSIGSSISLSSSDIAAATGGFFALMVLWFGFNLATLWLSGMDEHSLDWIGQTYVWFYGILAVVIALNLIAALVLLVPATLRTPKTS